MVTALEIAEEVHRRHGPTDEHGPEAHMPTSSVYAAAFEGTEATAEEIIDIIWSMAFPAETGGRYRPVHPAKVMKEWRRRRDDRGHGPENRPDHPRGGANGAEIGENESETRKIGKNQRFDGPEQPPRDE